MQQAHQGRHKGRDSQLQLKAVLRVQHLSVADADADGM
jgi:hypothetical protein